MTLDAILQAISERQSIHPELARPLGWHGLHRLLAREGIAVSTASIPEPAMLVQYRGQWTIILNVDLPPRRHMWAIVHELGHLWLHVDRSAPERWERVYHLHEGTGPDDREDDAEMFAACLLGGPRWF